MSFVKNVEQFFVNLWTNHLKPEGTEALDVAKSFFSAAIADVANILGVEGLKVITDAVTAAEQQGGTAGQKFAAATAAIASDLAALKISAPLHVVNAAIEGAVAQMNAVSPVVDDQVAAPQEPVPPTVQMPSQVASVPVTASVLENAITTVNAGVDVNTEAGNIVSNMGSQGTVITYADALAQLKAAVAAQAGR